MLTTLSPPPNFAAIVRTVAPVTRSYTGYSENELQRDERENTGTRVRLVPSRYLLVFEARVSWSERSARGVTGRGKGKIASSPSLPARFARSMTLSLRKQVNSDWVRVKTRVKKKTFGALIIMNVIRTFIILSQVKLFTIHLTSLSKSLSVEQ